MGYAPLEFLKTIFEMKRYIFFTSLSLYLVCCSNESEAEYSKLVGLWKEQPFYMHSDTSYLSIYSNRTGIFFDFDSSCYVHSVLTWDDSILMFNGMEWRYVIISDYHLTLEYRPSTDTSVGYRPSLSFVKCDIDTSTLIMCN